MTTPTLTDRYVAAAVRTVPEQQRADLAAELRASIDDQIDDRVEQGEARDAAERAVLTDLGDPDRLGAGYTDRPLWLIGPRYFLEWWRLLKLLLWIVPAAAAFGVSFAMVLDHATLGEIVGAVVPLILTVAVHLAFWTTLVFAIVERTSGRQGAGPLVTWTVDQLPDPRPSGAGRGELIATLVFLTIGAGAILWDLFIGFVPTEPGLSFLNPALWPAWILALFVVMALEAALAVAVYAVGRWTILLAVANGILNLLVAVPAVWLASQGQLINPAYFPTLIPDDGAEVGAIVNTILMFAIAVIAIWGTIDSAIKAARSARRPVVGP